MSCPEAICWFRTTNPGAMDSAGSVERWFALRVRPRQEKTTAFALQSKGFEEFLPLYRDRRRWSDRMKALEIPLFPRYVFCRFSLRTQLAVLTTPGVQSIVGMAKRPIPIDESEIVAIQAAMASKAASQPWPYLQVGQRVRIDRGPLKGLEGILVKIQSECCVVISLTLLMRSVAITIDMRDISPLGRPELTIGSDRQSAVKVGSFDELGSPLQPQSTTIQRL
jgi:transcription antitermination factor NusG